MYADPNFKTKKALKDAVKNGKTVIVFSKGDYGPPENGTISISGPSTGSHKWYARVTITDGKITKVT